LADDDGYHAAVSDLRVWVGAGTSECQGVSVYEFHIGPLRITRFYSFDDPILSLPPEKQQRKVIADCQRDLTIEADRLAQQKITERG
jgi:hypothetical protein